MTRLLQSPIDFSKTKKVFILILICFCLAPVLINTLLLVPLYSTLEADVVYSGSLLTIFIKYAQDLLDLCAFSVAYALMIFSMLLLTKKESRLTVIFYTITFFAQIPLKILMNVVIYGTVGNSFVFTVDIIYLSIYFFLQMLQLLIVCVFAKIDSGKFKNYVISLDDPKAKKSEEVKKILPFSKFINWYNPLLRSALKTGILILAIKLATRIVNDIMYGAPTSVGEVILMAVYYLSDVIYGAVAYIIIVLTMSAVYEKIKAKDGV